jgi:hypothetical protein
MPSPARSPSAIAGAASRAQVSSQVLRMTSFHAMERLVRMAPSGLHLNRRFSEDSLAYCNERLDPAPTRGALIATAKRAKRNKVFRNQPRIGLALDGTGAGHVRSKTPVCVLCHPFRDDDGNVVGHGHALAMISVVGANLSFPLDVEPYGPGDCELNGGHRLLHRVVEALGPRYADYVVADALYACASFLNHVSQHGLHAVVRLKDNLPDLHSRAIARFNARPPDVVFDESGDRFEVWDDDTFHPWEGLQWPWVRVIRYRQSSRDGHTIDAYWLTNYAPQSVGSRSLVRLAKSRWEIENQGFNEAKTRHGLEHICHHEKNSLLIGWLLLLLAIVIEQLYRVVHLHRGRHPIHTAAELVVLLLLALGRPVHDSS